MKKPKVIKTVRTWKRFVILWNDGNIGNFLFLSKQNATEQAREVSRSSFKAFEIIPVEIRPIRRGEL